MPPPAPEVTAQPSSMNLLLLAVAQGICKMGCRQQHRPLLEELVGLEKPVPELSDVVVEHCPCAPVSYLSTLSLAVCDNSKSSGWFCFI